MTKSFNKEIIKKKKQNKFQFLLWKLNIKIKYFCFKCNKWQ